VGHDIEDGDKATQKRSEDGGDLRLIEGKADLGMQFARIDDEESNA